MLIFAMVIAEKYSRGQVMVETSHRARYHLDSYLKTVECNLVLYPLYYLIGKSVVSRMFEN